MKNKCLNCDEIGEKSSTNLFFEETSRANFKGLRPMREKKRG